jgi:lipopolysaccharide heptosyltransferase II
MALGSAMTTLLKDRALAVELARQARRRVESHYPLARMVEQTLDVYREASGRLRILIIKLSAVGDLVLITPSLRALRARFPKANLTVLVGREGRELLHRCPYLDEWIVYDRDRDGTLAGLLRLGRRLRSNPVDLVVDFQNNRVSHWLGLFSGAPQRYGVAGRRWSWLLTHRVVYPSVPTPPVEQQLRLLASLGIQGASTHLELWPGPSAEGRVDHLLQDAWMADNQPLVAIHPGGNSRWLSKRWPAERYAQLIDRMASAAHVRVVLTGSAEERPLSRQIYRMVKVKPVLAVGLTSLEELAALLRRCQVLVSGDTAPLHMAAAVGTPFVALFGSTDPVRHLPPVPAGQVRLLKVNLPCSPCYHRVCYRLGSGHMECMRSISVEEVLEAVLSLLKKEVNDASLARRGGMKRIP